MMMSCILRAVRRGRYRAAWMLALMAVVSLSTAGPAWAAGAAPIITYDGSTDAAISFGATTYSGSSATPLFIPNNVTGLNDILASPGSNYQIVNPVVANNVASVGGIGTTLNPGQTLSLGAAGGNSADGAPFGAGTATIFGPYATFGLTDATPLGNGSASYGIESWTSHFTMNQDFVGTFGNYLAIGGNIGATGNGAAVASLVTEVFVTPAGGATVEYDFAPIILAAANTPGGPNLVADYDNVNGNAFSGAAVVLNGDGSFVGLGINNYNAALTAGTTIDAVSTITFYADPASIDIIAPDLNLIPGARLPELSFGSAAIPEPGSVIMGGTALLSLSLVGWMRRRARRTAP